MLHHSVRMRGHSRAPGLTSLQHLSLEFYCVWVTVALLGQHVVLACLLCLATWAEACGRLVKTQSEAECAKSNQKPLWSMREEFKSSELGKSSTGAAVNINTVRTQICMGIVSTICLVGAQVHFVPISFSVVPEYLIVVTELWIAD